MGWIGGLPINFFVFLLGGALVFAFLLAILLRISGCAKGWKALESYYAFHGTYDGKIKLSGGHVDLFKCQIGADKRGLYLFTPGQSDLLIPWDKMKFSGATYATCGVIDIEIENVCDVSVSIDRTHENVMKDAAGNQWPRIQEAL